MKKLKGEMRAAVGSGPRPVPRSRNCTWYVIMDLKVTPSVQTIVKPMALGPVANADTKLLIYGLFQKGRVLAQDGIDARRAYAEFVTKWTPLAPAVVRSLEDAGEHLLTFYEFPRPMWKSTQTTNPLENLNREFRRRTKTQASFATEESAVALLFGLVASGQIRLRRIDGYKTPGRWPCPTRRRRLI